MVPWKSNASVNAGTCLSGPWKGAGIIERLSNLQARIHYSNEIHLEPGIVAGKFVGEGKMTVLDLSVSGFKVKLKKKEDLKIDDRLQVAFYLKDDKRTLIRETATIKNIHKKYIGGAFLPSRLKSRDLGVLSARLVPIHQWSFRALPALEGMI